MIRKGIPLAAIALIIAFVMTPMATASSATASAAAAGVPARSRLEPPAGYADGVPVGGGTSQTAPTQPASNTNGGTLSFGVQGALETAQGTALTDAMPALSGDYLTVHGLGTIALMSAGGRVVWQRPSTSLYQDWHLQWQGTQTEIPTPQVTLGGWVSYPLVDAGDVPGVVENDHPYAVGDLTGNGTTDVVVAQTVGVALADTGMCTLCSWLFTVPGSALHVGTFVTVLNGVTGRTLYWQLYPGFVTQLAIAGRTLVVGNETGSPSRPGGIGEWYSTTTVSALRFHTSGAGLGATVQWRYDTGSPWARLLGLTPMGANGVAVAWTDTPLGLGVPGPPDGHIIALATQTGTVEWQQSTSAYPTFSAYDPASHLLAVVEQEDPTQGVSYALTALRPQNGSVAFAVVRGGAVATTLAIGGDLWLVGAANGNTRTITPPYYTPVSGRLTAVDPDSEQQVWSVVTSAPGYGPLQPASILDLGTTVVLASWLPLSTGASPTQPNQYDTDLQGLSPSTGRRLWDDAGDSAAPLSISVDSGMVREVTPEQSSRLVDPVTGAVVATTPLMGTVTAVVAVGQDLIVGDQSGGLYALNAASLQPVWQTTVAGPVVSITEADLAGNGVPDLVVSATTTLAVVDARQGRIDYQVGFPGQYVWTAAVGSLGTSGGDADDIVVPTTGLTALDGITGQQLWQWQPPVPAYLSDAAITSGVVVSEYTGIGSKRHMAEVGVGPGGATKWSATQEPSTTSSAQLQGGVAAGPAIPASGGLGAAFTWNTPTAGRVDVRNAVTGALLYSDASTQLEDHAGFVLEPNLGLIAYGQGVVDITASGPISHNVPAGGAGVATMASGHQVFVTAETAAQAYPIAMLTSSDANPAPLAENSTFLPSQLLVAPLGGQGDSVVTWPRNSTLREVLAEEEGQPTTPYSVPSQQGVVVLGLSGTPAASAAHGPTVASGPTATRPDTIAVAQAPLPGFGQAVPFSQLAVRGYSNAGTPLVASSAPAGYSPATIDAYLGTTASGAGQTIDIVDAYADPTLVGDVDTFSHQFGLPSVCKGSNSTGCFDLTVSQPEGRPQPDSDWALETSLDVEWVHAIVPRAHIVLVEPVSSEFSAMFAAVQDAAALRPDAVSMSWGIDEEFSGETYYDHFCQVDSSVCVVSSGDDGYPGSYPAYNPYVLAIGGTTLTLTPTGSVTSEVSWASSGGGSSYFESAPADQREALGILARGIPDVSFDADPNTGVAVYDSTPYQGQSGWFEVGGTSVGAPSWSALLAGADQLRAAAGEARLTAGGLRAQTAVYSLPAGTLYDITTGPPNGGCPILCAPGPGYDYVTGLGSPQSGLEGALVSG